MFVYCATPRKRTFTTFTDSKRAAKWLRANVSRVINVRNAHGRIIVNHFAK